ncbi:MAG: hypothetical protein PHE84_01560 [bacterium]|nr:hypothetical protein [bacterium]
MKNNIKARTAAEAHKRKKRASVKRKERCGICEYWIPGNGMVASFCSYDMIEGDEFRGPEVGPDDWCGQFTRKNS